MQLDFPTILGAGIVAAFMVFVFMRILLPNLKAMKAGQYIREDGPQSHMSKAGTPTMGGLAIIAAILLSSLLVKGPDSSVFSMLLLTFGFGLIGFLDDYIKVVKKRNLGLRAWQKIVLQLVFSGAFAYFEYLKDPKIYIPYAKIWVSFGVWFIPFAMLVVIAASNAVNLTDGLDGLASGVTIVVSFFLCLFSFMLEKQMSSVFAAFVMGSCIGFLFYNRHPAKVFMGDTGSMALGGALAGISITAGLEFVLVIVGGIYVAEAASVILQVFVFKTQHGRRLFRMAPLHHHIELGGWSENKILILFASISAVLGIIALAGI